MNYLILTETEFFGLINGNDETINLNAAYGCFVKAVVELLSDNDTDGVKIALAYAENELEYHNTQYLAGGVKSHTDLFVRKALSFVRKMQKQISTSRLQVPPLSPSYPSPPSTAHSVPTLKWTGNAIDLVEMIYGISEMGCINDGEIPLKELAPVLYSFFGVNSKDCYRFYTDIKRRKNDSRTYFLDRMQKKLNEKMQRDDELERMRR
ncbi:RteC domain-containing protein [Phocaeicola barnesiae]|uniref:RteC domain-containing protein n=1 Tax=Phocaeicola barnesiae TaxID=376804 RepID=UPI0025A4B101|nr:RteC domain-containing protein [Phocaeicola barnesiae]MDM8254912.1 RteC domain-containing protein [Phocaeicola barnesiae]